MEIDPPSHTSSGSSPLRASTAGENNFSRRPCSCPTTAHSLSTKPSLTTRGEQPDGLLYWHTRHSIDRHSPSRSWKRAKKGRPLSGRPRYASLSAPQMAARYL